jgi:glycosyltransferase involved in cell wall biosynthesis
VEPYFVILGTIEARKNHWLLLQVWRRLIERFGAATPRLVIIGRRGWECENVLDMLERCAPLDGIVIERGNCSDHDVAVYLQHAQALLMPSFAEGYGLPVVEALSAGLPVIASDLAIFHEIAGETPDYVDPLDGTRWAELIVQYAAGGGLRNEQLQRLARYRAATWREHFDIVDALVRRVGALA